MGMPLNAAADTQVKVGAAGDLSAALASDVVMLLIQFRAQIAQPAGHPPALQVHAGAQVLGLQCTLLPSLTLDCTVPVDRHTQ